MKDYTLTFYILLILVPCLHGLNQDSVTLDQSVQMAMEQNSRIIAENLDRQDAWRRLRLQLRLFLPSLQLGFSKTDSVTQGAPDSRVRKLSLSMNQLLFNGGRDLAAYRSSERNLQLRDLKAQDLIDSIAHEVTLQYVDVLKNSQILEIQRRSYENLLEQIRIAALEVELGVLRETDYLEIRISAVEYSLNIRDTEELLLKSRYALASLMSLPLEQLPPLMGHLNQDYRGDYATESGDLQNLIPDMKNKAQEYNKDLMSLYLQEAHARRVLLDSRISWIPKIEGTADYSVSAMDFPLDEPSFSLGIIFTFQTPLLPGSVSLQAGKSNPLEHNASAHSEVNIAENLEGLIDPITARSSLYKTQLQREELRRSIAFQVGSLSQSIQLNLQRLEINRDKISLESEKLIIEEARMKIGELTRLDYVKSEIRLSNHQTELIENIVALYSLEKELEKICGITSNRQGGSLIWYSE
ncbi:TolC family protein [Oceanispirochaeta sp.]|jgi:outer membrane protein TolC|uniref:TolC family protein n=1 Tax=Oceanispirochaeta sp. TaxID=2035350 RepID=UPI00261183BD|nr:TolC family protein [Oceanispirochaeta sp.]MDA3958002.1 TolC family protein [Oceanispirochaeta sp.]